MRTLLFRIVPLVVLGLAVLAPAEASAQRPPNPRPNPVPYSASEPRAKEFSFTRSAHYLDTVGKFWMKDACGSCHSNYTYFLARPPQGESIEPVALETRRFMESRVAAAQKDLKLSHREFIQFQSETVGLALALVSYDAQTTGKLQPTTRQALETMWAYQKQGSPRHEGTWNCGCGDFPMAELDRYYVATLAALAVGMAPENYARSPEANDGLTRLRRYLMRNSPPHLHHRAMLLWASLHLDGLMTRAEQQVTVQALLQAQRSDGGWEMGSMIHEARVGSDGYATGLVVYVLRQAGVSAKSPPLVRGVEWLKTNQRASGGWFTFSPQAGDRPEGGHGTRELSVLNTGAAFAVMALRACEAKEEAHVWHPTTHGKAGLALRTDGEPVR